MNGLNKREIANHIDTSVNEIFPFDRQIDLPERRGGNITTNGEFAARNFTAPSGHLRDDRSFTQSLWGRR
jgi:hypothetical protein